jgi:hypothetical protein
MQYVHSDHRQRVRRVPVATLRIILTNQRDERRPLADPKGVASILEPLATVAGCQWLTHRISDRRTSVLVNKSRNDIEAVKRSGRESRPAGLLPLPDHNSTHEVLSRLQRRLLHPATTGYDPSETRHERAHYCFWNLGVLGVHRGSSPKAKNTPQRPT